MSGTERAAGQDLGDRPVIDTSVAHSARVHDYWLGGKDNFAADRAAGDAVIQAYPGVYVAAVYFPETTTGVTFRTLWRRFLGITWRSADVTSRPAQSRSGAGPCCYVPSGRSTIIWMGSARP